MPVNRRQKNAVTCHRHGSAVRRQETAFFWRSYLPPAWLSGAAAASVVVVAVLLVYPQPWDKVTNPNEVQIEELVENESFADEDASPAAKTKPLPDPNREAKTELRMVGATGQAAELMQSQAAPMSADAIASPPLDEQTIRDSLIEIRTLRSSGNAEQAEQSWVALKHRCPSCALPAELDEAIALYLPKEAE